MDSKCYAKPSIAGDESTVEFKGRNSFITYNPQKPTKWGLRIYVLAESESGYIEPYFGKPTTKNLPHPDAPFTTRIVLHLVDQVPDNTSGSGCQLYTD